MDENKLKLTICVPTNNRGKRALSMVESILNDRKFDHSLHLLILDNASDKETAAYHEIMALAEDVPNLTYKRHEENLRFHGNYLACFKLSRSPYIMALSDEDFPVLSTIREVLPSLDASSNIGIIRGAIGSSPGAPKLNASKEKDSVLEAGEQALTTFALTNNYFSGTIYNKALLEKLKLIDRLEENLAVHALYPHTYLEILACAVCDVKTISSLCCIEGTPEMEGQLDPPPTTYYPGAYSFGGRVDQIFLLRDAFREAIQLIGQEFDLPLFIISYLRLCEKYCYLVTKVNAATYANHGIHPEFLHQSLLPIFEAGLTTYPEMSHVYPAVQAEIRKIHEKYKGLWN